MSTQLSQVLKAPPRRRCSELAISFVDIRSSLHQQFLNPAVVLERGVVKAVALPITFVRDFPIFADCRAALPQSAGRNRSESKRRFTRHDTAVFQPTEAERT